MPNIVHGTLAALANETRQSYRTEDMPADSVALFLDGLQPGNVGADRAD